MGIEISQSNLGGFNNISFSCACPVIDHEFRHIVKEALFNYIYLYLLATQQKSEMIIKESNKLIQIKKRGKRKKIYTCNIL